MIDFIEHNFSDIANFRIISTQRKGGYSLAPYQELNLGDHVADDPHSVARNRAALIQQFDWVEAPRWLTQVHGTDIVQAEQHSGLPPSADGLICRQAHIPCAILTADCLPLVLARIDSPAFVCLHVGWKGLAAGIIEAGISKLGGSPDCIRAWAGPAIGPLAFEVGGEVKAALGGPEMAWQPQAHSNKWLLNLYLLTGYRLEKKGINGYEHVSACTYSEPEHYFSYRRDGVTGRQATIAWRTQ